MFVVHETSPDFRFSLTSRKPHVELKQLTEVLKLSGFASSYVQRILASAVGNKLPRRKDTILR